MLIDINVFNKRKIWNNRSYRELRKEMKIHLHWEEDDRICHMPDGNDFCPGCCLEKSPIKEYDVHWECIWKKDHEGTHCDIWCNEWEMKNDKPKDTP